MGIGDEVEGDFFAEVEIASEREVGDDYAFAQHKRLQRQMAAEHFQCIGAGGVSPKLKTPHHPKG